MANKIIKLDGELLIKDLLSTYRPLQIQMASVILRPEVVGNSSVLLAKHGAYADAIAKVDAMLRQCEVKFAPMSYGVKLRGLAEISDAYAM